MEAYPWPPGAKVIPSSHILFEGRSSHYQYSWEHVAAAWYSLL